MIRRPERSAPAQWVAPDAPTFAVVGRVNMGKSAVLATLLEEDDDAIIRISAEPGETTACKTLSIDLQGRERVRFVDTPGFQQPVEALRAIRALAGDAGAEADALGQFVARYGDDRRFADECRLLAPIVEGAGVIYIADPGVAVHDAFVAEIEILRRAAGPKLAVLNARAGADQPARFVAQWQRHLAPAFDRVRAFNAHAADHASRSDLLRSLAEIDPDGAENILAAIDWLDAEWRQRREQAAERVATFMRAALALRERIDYAAPDASAASRAKASAVATATRRYYARLADIEREAGNDLLGIYRHRRVRAENELELGPDLALSQTDTWQRLGLTRAQLTVAGAAAGSGVGLSADALALGQTLGLGALVGGAAGAGLAWFRGDRLPSLSLSVGNRVALGDQRLTLGPPDNPNFAWILLDSLLIRYRRVLACPHARRDGAGLAGPPAGQARAVVARLPRARQKLLARWFRDLGRDPGPTERDEPALAALEQTLVEIENGALDR